MFSIIPYQVERDRQGYNTQCHIPKDTKAYAIKLDKVNDTDYYFTFSYLNFDKAKEIANKLWWDKDKFIQGANRSDNFQLTLISELE